MIQLIPIIQGKANTNVVIYFDGFKTYNGLVDFGYKKALQRSNKVKIDLLLGVTILTGLKTLGALQFRLTKLRGVHKHIFYWHIKGCEFRYKYIYLTLLANFRK